MSQAHITRATELMDGFAQRTGLDPRGEQARYLWTDAFAVCNYLGLSRLAQDGERYARLAGRLVDDVHHVLGQHRPDDRRTGWLSGLRGSEAEEHPTAGGLRIGKPLSERRPEEPFDERLEWDRDGQYFHYLTKWIHSLDLMARDTGQARYHRWARELAAAAYDGFVYEAGDGAPRMYWKMSSDLSHPLVPSMGQHDPLDGWITERELAATARELGETAGDGDRPRAEAFASMLERTQLSTADPLGLGGLLVDSLRTAQLMQRGTLLDAALLDRLLTAAQRGLEVFAKSADLHAPAARRLAFRELGLAIGLDALDRLSRIAEGSKPRLELSSAIHRRIRALERFLPLSDRIESFWLEPEHRREPIWLEHRDINDVMLATALVPEGCLSSSPLRRGDVQE